MLVLLSLHIDIGFYLILNLLLILFYSYAHFYPHPLSRHDEVNP